MGDLALREPAPVGELDYGPLVRGQDFRARWTAPRGHVASASSDGSQLASRAVLELGDTAQGVRLSPSVIALRATA